MQLSEEQHESIQKILDQIEAMVSTSYDVSPDTIKVDMIRDKDCNEENFTRELDLSSQEVVNYELIRKTRKISTEKDSSVMRKASHQRFMKGINETFIKANGIGLGS